MSSFKDYIGAKDLRLWDGITRTFKRLTSTGGQLTQNKIGSVVDILEVYGSGDSYTNTTLQLAISSIGSRAVTLLFQPGTWTIAANVTIPSNISIMVPQGVTISVSTGITLTISGTIIAGAYQIFDGAGTIAGSPILDFKNAYWFSGTVTDSTTPTYKNVTGGTITGTVLKSDTISEVTAAAGVTIDGVKLKDSEPYCDVINEKTAATGVTIDSVRLMDNTVRASTLESTVATGTAPLTIASTTEVTNLRAATATKVTDGTNLIHTKIIATGDWDMDLTAGINIAHGLTFANIRSVTAMIRDDANNYRYMAVNQNFSSAPFYISEINNTNIVLARLNGGAFDQTTFDSTSYNRGWVTITYVE